MPWNLHPDAHDPARLPHGGAASARSGVREAVTGPRRQHVGPAGIWQAGLGIGTPPACPGGVTKGGRDRPSGGCFARRDNARSGGDPPDRASDRSDRDPRSASRRRCPGGASSRPFRTRRGPPVLCYIPVTVISPATVASRITPSPSASVPETTFVLGSLSSSGRLFSVTSPTLASARKEADVP